jgi:hypothetical protein
MDLQPTQWLMTTLLLLQRVRVLHITLLFYASFSPVRAKGHAQHSEMSSALSEGALLAYYFTALPPSTH